MATETRVLSSRPSGRRLVVSALAWCGSAAGVVLVWRAMTRMTDGADIVVDALFAVSSGVLGATVLRLTADRAIVVAGAVIGTVAAATVIYMNVMIGWIYDARYIPTAATGVALATLALVAFGVGWDEAEVPTGVAIKRLAMGGVIGVAIAWGAISAFLVVMAFVWLGQMV